jgi:hypothetical protein
MRRFSFDFALEAENLAGDKMVGPDRRRIVDPNLIPFEVPISNHLSQNNIYIHYLIIA